MSFYRDLQLDTAVLKERIRSGAASRQQVYYGTVLTAKAVLTLLFCTGFIVLYSVLFGAENSTAGVAVLLCVLAFQNADFGVSLGDSLKLLVFYFAVIAFLPAAAHLFGPAVGLAMNLTGIFSLYLVGCARVELFNHSTLVLGYLLLYGYEVSGELYLARLMALAVGCVLTCLIFYHKHRRMENAGSIADLLRGFTLKDAQAQWKLQSALAISIAVFVGELLALPRPMWAGIAAMSVLVPYAQQIRARAHQRVVGTVVGIGLFFALCFLLPEHLYAIIGTLGGLCLGFCTKYGEKVPFTTCGGLCAAVGTYGFGAALALRFVQNLFGVLCAVAVSLAVGRLCRKLCPAHR